MRVLLSVLIFSFIIYPCFAQVGPGGYTPRSIYDVSDGTSVNCSPYEIEVSPSTLSCQNGVAKITNNGGGSMTYPSGSGIAQVSSGTSWGTTIGEVDGDCVVGSGGAWIAGSCGSGSQTPWLSNINGGGYTLTNAGENWASIEAITPFPIFNQNTSGTSANLSGTPALPNGTTATTQSQADNSTKLATTAYVDTGLGNKAATNQTMYIGTTSTAINRASAAQALTGITSIDNGTTGVTIATSSSDKIGAFGATPVAQQTGNVCTAMTNLGFVTSCTEAVSSVSNSDSTLTISPTTGAVVASLNLGHANSWTAKQSFPAATTSNASINLATSGGTNVTSPNSGDLWWNGTNLYFYNGSANKDLLAGGGGGGTPGGSNTQVQYNNSSSFGGITNATSDGTTLTITSPKIVTQIQDTNANELLGITATSSAVNYLTLANAATTTNPTITAAGSDTNVGIGLTTQGTGQVVVTGSTANPQITLGSQTLQSTAVQGGLEDPGNNLTFTPNSSNLNRGAIPAEQMMALTSSYQLSSSSAQKIFNVGSSSNGSVYLNTSTTYYFEMLLYVSGISSTGGTVSLTFAGGTVGSIFYEAIGEKNAAIGTSTATDFIGACNVATACAISTSTTGTTMSVWVHGIIRMTTGASVTPELSESQSATATIAANSFFLVYPIETNTTTTEGNIV